MSQIYNPYLPLNEYVPDGEPRVFGNRVYIYGSHDSAHASVYCPGHYVTWSASVEDLTDWRYEGVIYKRNQDPSNADDTLQLWAPDATQGPDGRYYIYYCFNFRQDVYKRQVKIVCYDSRSQIIFCVISTKNNQDFN